MEKLPNIYSPKNYQYNQNKNIISKQSIKQRNDVIDEYIKSLDNKNERKQNENSLSNSEDDKDPFSPTSLKRVKSIKKLILPIFKKREIIKSQSSTTKWSKKLKKKNNNSDNNIINRHRKDVRIPNFKGVNNLLNSKWSTSSSNYINYINHSRKNDDKIFYNSSIYNYEKLYRNYTSKIKQGKKNQRINSTLNTQKILENKRKIYEKLIKEKNNPYGLNWVTKIFRKNKGEKIELSKREFSNGVPIIKLLGKRELNKREIKKKLSEIYQKKKEEESKYNKLINAKSKLDKNELDDEYNIPNEILEQFNQNKKNFFKFRNDIIEKPEEEEEK
jgi:hypothetical protein